MSLVATRFAPSPTGPLHIGGIRTALFNWLFSKNNKGKFYLRIEDTDRERSKDEYKNQIIQSLKWIGIEHDDKEYIQSKNINKHIEVASELIKKGFAYKCYCSEDEIKEQKEKAKKKGMPFMYNRKWRESKDLKIPIIAILDSNSDPDGIDFPIPGNDDARRSIDLYCNLLKETIINAKKETPSTVDKINLETDVLKKKTENKQKIDSKKEISTNV